METEGKKLVRFDWAMKRMLRHKTDHRVLEGFLTSLLGRQIIIKNILESESNKEYDENKLNRVDLLAENELGEKILIEVQNETEHSYFHRMIFGTSRLVSEYLKKGEGYENIQKVYSINIVYFNLGEGSDYVYHGRTEFHGIHDHELLRLPAFLQKKFDKREIYEIFPEYYILRANDFDKWSVDPIDQWLYFFANSEIPAEASAPGLDCAREQLAIHKMNKADRDAYYHYLDDVRSSRTAMEDKAYEALHRGIQEGMKQGIQHERIELVKTMRSNGLSSEQISKFTSIPAEEVENILSSSC